MVEEKVILVTEDSQIPNNFKSIGKFGTDLVFECLPDLESHLKETKQWYKISDKRKIQLAKELIVGSFLEKKYPRR